jgi:uncharacterized protein YjiK
MFGLLLIMERSFPICLVLLLTIALPFSSCQKDKKYKSQPNPNKLEYSTVREIPVVGPSGLDLTFEEDGFWVVSDETKTAYKLNSFGIVVKKIEMDGKDLEGITVVDERRLAVVLEETQEVIIVDTAGVELKREKLDVKSKENSGLEGITYDPKQKRFYILNEKKPCLLITLDENLNLLSTVTLDFAKDVSGIYFDERDSILWIVSDESRLIVKADLKGNPIEKMEIPVVQAEGITLEKSGEKLYVISDDRAALYVFDLK